MVPPDLIAELLGLLTKLDVFDVNIGLDKVVEGGAHDTVVLVALVIRQARNMVLLEIPLSPGTSDEFPDRLGGLIITRCRLALSQALSVVAKRSSRLSCLSLLDLLLALCPQRNAPAMVLHVSKLRVVHHRTLLAIGRPVRTISPDCHDKNWHGHFRMSHPFFDYVEGTRVSSSALVTRTIACATCQPASLSVTIAV